MFLCQASIIAKAGYDISAYANGISRGEGKCASGTKLEIQLDSQTLSQGLHLFSKRASFSGSILHTIHNMGKLFCRPTSIEFGGVRPLHWKDKKV